jgi:hypothetical protein
MDIHLPGGGMEWRSISEPGDWRSIDEGDAPPVRPAPAPLRISSRPREIIIRGKLATEPAVYRRRGRVLTVSVLAALLTRFVGWSASIAGHFVLFAVLVGVLLMSKPPEDETYLEVGFHDRDGGNQGQVMAPPQAPVAPEPVKEPPKPEPPKPEPEPPKPEPKPEPPTPASIPEKPATAVEQAAEPAAIGAGAGTNAAPPKPVEPVNVEKDPTAAVAQKRIGEIARLKKGKKRDIVCVAGAYDKVEDVLSKLEVPHTVVDGEDFGAYDLSDCAVLLVNCDDTFGTGTTALAPKEIERITGEIAQLEKRIDDLKKRLDAAKDRRTASALQMQLATAIATRDYKKDLVDASDKATKTARKIRDFVAKGGYLFSSDWGLTVVEQAFPGAVKRGGDVGPKSVRIAPRKGEEAHFLLEEVFAAKPKGGTTTASKPLKWEIDASSHLIKVEDTAVETIIDSPDLVTHKAIAVTFLHDGRKVVSPGSEGSSRPGRVLHILSHFYNQADRFGDYGLQNLLVNFLVGRIERK